MCLGGLLPIVGNTVGITTPFSTLLRCGCWANCILQIDIRLGAGSRERTSPLLAVDDGHEELHTKKCFFLESGSLKVDFPRKWPVASVSGSGRAPERGCPHCLQLVMGTRNCARKGERKINDQFECQTFYFPPSS